MALEHDLSHDAGQSQPNWPHERDMLVKTLMMMSRRLVEIMPLAHPDRRQDLRHALDATTTIRTVTEVVPGFGASLKVELQNDAGDWIKLVAYEAPERDRARAN